MRKFTLYGTDVTITFRKKGLLAGLLAGAVLIAVYAAWSDRPGLTQGDSGSGRQGIFASRTLPAPLPGSLASGAVAADSGSAAGVAQTLQAVRDSLQRNDLASARVLLNAMRALHKDDEQVSALRNDLQAREDKANPVADAPSLAHSGQPDKTRELPRSVPRASARSARAGESSLPTGEHAVRPSRYARSREAARGKVAPERGEDVVAASPAPETRETASILPPPAASVASAPVEPRPVPATPPSLPVVEVARPDPQPVQADQGQKTRAQVREELARARSDGTLPRFGNPDPAGPGGTPSLTVKPGALPDRD